MSFNVLPLSCYFTYLLNISYTYTWQDGKLLILTLSFTLLQVDYFSYGVEDFALYMPPSLTPSKRVLLLRFKNRFETLVQSLVLKGLNVTSAYPVTWTRKDWSPQEERLAKEVDVVYFHDTHGVVEWKDRLPDKEVIAACHDE